MSKFIDWGLIFGGGGGEKKDNVAFLGCDTHPLFFTLLKILGLLRIYYRTIHYNRFGL